MTDENGGSRQHPPEDQCRALAARQFGVLSRDQAKTCGMSDRAIDRRIETKKWRVVLPSVYIVFPTHDAWLQSLMAACLWGDGQTVASHRSAGGLWQLDGVSRGMVEITVTKVRRSPRPGLLLHRTSRLPKADRTKFGVIPVTSVGRTLVDLGSVETELVVEEALDCALRRRLTSIPRLRWRLEELGTQGRKGAAVLRRILDERPESTRPTESALEVRVARLIRGSDLPPPERQYVIRDQGSFVARVDFAYPSARLAIEVDGYEFHHGRARWQRDLIRRSELARLGWRVIHVTADDVRNRSGEILESIREALETGLLPTLLQ
jgi:very-short-patch-repair endonuclease